MIVLIINTVQSVIPHVTEKLKLKVLQIEFFFFKCTALNLHNH